MNKVRLPISDKTRAVLEKGFRDRQAKLMPNKPFYGKGTIDLNNRKAVKNQDGSISTERSFSFYDEDTGKEVLVPTVINGKIVSDNEAIDHYYKTGAHLGMFDTPNEADRYAEALHRRQERFYK